MEKLLALVPLEMNTIQYTTATIKDAGDNYFSFDGTEWRLTVLLRTRQGCRCYARAAWTTPPPCSANSTYRPTCSASTASGGPRAPATPSAHRSSPFANDDIPRRGTDTTLSWLRYRARFTTRRLVQDSSGVVYCAAAQCGPRNAFRVVQSRHS